MINRILIWFYFIRRRNHKNHHVISSKGNKNILVLSPHVDDETIGLGGTLIKYAKEGAKLNLVYLTDGSGSTSHKSKEEVIKERMEEGYKIRDSYGFDNVYFLGETDGTLDSKKSNLLDRLVNILEKENPNIIFSPFLIDGNIDHVETTKAMAKALELWDNSFEDIYLYQVNTIIDPDLVNVVNLLNDKEFKEKLDKFDIFKSQWAMGFSIFHSLDKGRALMYREGFAAEAFVNLDLQTLEETIKELEIRGFSPQIFRQISSEFTLLPSFMKSRKEKAIYNALMKDIMANKELGGKPFRAH